MNHSIEAGHLSQPDKRLSKIRLPRMLLNPIFAARLTLAALTGFGVAAGADFAGSKGSVKAADVPIFQCEETINIIAFRYFDRFPVDGVGKAGEIDREDFVLGPLVQQKVELNKNGKPLKTAILEPRQGYSYAHIELKKEDNVDCGPKQPAGQRNIVGYGFGFESEKDKTYGLSMDNPGNIWLYSGVPEGNLDKIEEFLADPNHQVWEAGPQAQKIGIETKGETTYSWAPVEHVRIDNSPSNRAVLGGLLTKAKEIGEKKAKEEADKQAQAILVKIEQAKIDQASDDQTKERNRLILFTILGLITHRFLLGRRSRQWKKAYDVLMDKYNNVSYGAYAASQADPDVTKELKTKLSRATSENKTLQDENAELQGEVKSLEQILEDLKDELADEQAKNASGESNVGLTWSTGRQEFRKKWKAKEATLSAIRPGETGNEPEYVLARFKAGMGIIHDLSSTNGKSFLDLGTVYRAGVEYLIPKIWPDNRIFRAFFSSDFNKPEDLARIFYLPENYPASASSLTTEQKKHITRIHRILVVALHPDIYEGIKDKADPKLQDSIEFLFKRVNTAWPTIERMVK